jgi:hypothetical protein
MLLQGMVSCSFDRSHVTVCTSIQHISSSWWVTGSDGVFSQHACCAGHKQNHCSAPLLVRSRATPPPTSALLFTTGETDILPLPLALCAPRNFAISMCSSWSLICFLQHRSDNQLPRSAFGFQKSTQNLRTHSGTNCWCRSEARYMSFVLDSPGW